MGFCLFNNVAVAAAIALQDPGVDRVMVLDWDVHAGNGTAEIFRERPDVLLACLHEHGLYPGTGPLHDAGSGAGEGYTLNLPVPPGSEEPLWLALVDEVVLPVARAYAPDLVLVSAGFDAHRLDPLARCRLETESFARIAGRVHGLSEELGLPVGVMLEGGYHSEVLAECVCAVLPVLAGATPPADEVAGKPGQSLEPLGDHARALVDAARAQAARRWRI
jgi:acetoin utilization deacetylase AcuC-like enzyme